MPCVPAPGQERNVGSFTSASHCARRLISSGAAAETDLTTPTLSNIGRNQPVNRHLRMKDIRKKRLSAAFLFASVQVPEVWQDGAGQRTRHCQ